jgi:hypothetical protein
VGLKNLGPCVRVWFGMIVGCPSVVCMRSCGWCWLGYLATPRIRTRRVPTSRTKEHIDAAQQHGVDGEEVTGQHRRRLDPAELPLRRFTASFDAVFAGVGIAVLRNPPRASRANAYAERWVGMIRRECLDRMLLFHERQLRHVVADRLQRNSTNLLEWPGSADAGPWRSDQRVSPRRLIGGRRTSGWSC